MRLNSNQNVQLCICDRIRPGLAPIAGSLAVELLVALLHHPHGIHAPGESKHAFRSAENNYACLCFLHLYFRNKKSYISLFTFPADVVTDLFTKTESPLGIVPHQVLYYNTYNYIK